ncbi:MAG: hypothetical protein ACI9R3_004147 [Verrucomicrobiales bacterium]|jgi:hypothetical protein
MPLSSVLKLSGLVLLVSLVIGTGVYQNREDSNLLYLFGLYMLTGILGAFYFFKVILPAIGDSITTALVDSGEEPEEPPMVRIRELVASGEYDTAAEELVHVAAANPGDQVPWLERAELLNDKLSDSKAAIQTLEVGLKSFAWEQEVAAVFMFQIVELQEKSASKEEVVATLDRIIERFPNTRYSANASHKKRTLTGVAPRQGASGKPSNPPPPGAGSSKRVTPPPPSAS